MKAIVPTTTKGTLIEITQFTVPSAGITPMLANLERTRYHFKIIREGKKPVEFEVDQREFNGLLRFFGA